MFDFLPFYDAGEDSIKHLWGAPERGDVIVFEAPTSPGRDFIKRIIGLPGDTVEITTDGKVIVNGTVLDEPYAAGTTACSGSECKWAIPLAGTQESQTMCKSDACYFVMGDNRQNSSDSRQGWLVPEENIIGKTLITYWQDGGLDVKLAPNETVAADDGTEP
jgi:signal peptidase I